MEEIGAYQAKTLLPEILRRVAAGESFTVTRHGKAIADIVPSQQRDTKAAQEAVSALLNAQKHRSRNSSAAPLSDTELKDRINAGRR